MEIEKPNSQDKKYWSEDKFLKMIFISDTDEFIQSQQSKIEELERENDNLKESSKEIREQRQYWLRKSDANEEENTKLKQSLSEALEDLNTLNEKYNELSAVKDKNCQ